MKKENLKPLMMSKRAEILYLEKAKVFQLDEVVAYSQVGENGIQEFYFNIPDKNTCLVLLGMGTSITNSAARKLAESNVIVGFCGSGGSPLISATDMSFLAPQSEYRPTEYMQNWAKMWFDEELRLEKGRELLRMRFQAALDNKIVGDAVVRLDLMSKVERAKNSQELLLIEGNYVKALYQSYARHHDFEFTRDKDGIDGSDSMRVVNNFLNHGNYLAYGLSAVVLHTLGISFAFPLLHGKTRRGALVFDIADLIKDAYIVPVAFELGKKQVTQQQFRVELIRVLGEEKVLNKLFEKVSRLL